jgi:hypothetical protein
MPDPVVERLVGLHKKLENAAKEGGGAIKGWHPLRFDSKGWIVAGKTVSGTYRTRDFQPVGEWKKAAEYLELENELRTLLFSDLTPDQINAYRTAIGLPPAKGAGKHRRQRN